MLHCLKSSQAAATENFHSPPQPFQVSSADITPRSESQSSPSLNLANEYALAMQTNSYSEIRVFFDLETEQPGEITQEHHLMQVLRPNRECVEEALQHSKPSSLTNLLWSFFDHTEYAAHMCLDLNQTIRRVRTLIAPLLELLLVLPLDSETDSLTSPQCDRVFDLLLGYEQLENPFPGPGPCNVHGMRHCFSELYNQIEDCINKSNSRIRLLHRATRASAVCLIGTAVGIVISGVVIASHALVALVAIPLLPPCIPSKMEKQELSSLTLLDVAQRGIFVLQKDIVTIDRMVDRLHADIEGNRRFMRGGLSQGKNKHSILEVAKMLRRSNINFHKQLAELEDNLCLCFAVINRVRSDLLQAINLHQSNQ